MNSELENKFLNASDHEVQKHLGIKDFNKRTKSYGKILYSHSIITYDTNSIYCIDKLHLTFISNQKTCIKLVNAFNLKKDITIDEFLILKPNFSNGNNYHYSFKIEFEGVHLGYIHLNNTKRTNCNKVEVDNRILYERSIIFILSRLFHITQLFDLKLSNLNMYEIAKDTTIPVYDNVSETYYQSTKCNSTVHKLSGNAPKYRPLTKVKIHDYPDDSGKHGTFLIGAKNSESMIKVYNKTYEIAQNDFKKDYIHEIHLNHFGTNNNINRVEATLFSNAFCPTGILGFIQTDLIELLRPTNFPIIFYKALGEKLTFNDITTKTWDGANNDKYNKIRLVPQPDTQMVKQKKLPLIKNEIRFSHNNHVNKYKFKLNEYMDNDITYNELKRYFHSKKKNMELNIDELFKSFEVVKRNYNNTLCNKKKLNIERLMLRLKDKSVPKSLWNRILGKIKYNNL